MTIRILVRGEQRTKNNVEAFDESDGKLIILYENGDKATYLKATVIKCHKSNVYIKGWLERDDV